MYNYFGVNAAELADATAGEILRATAVETRWLHCQLVKSQIEIVPSYEATPAGACDAPLSANEFVLRIFGSAVAVKSGYVPLGNSMIDVGIGAGVLSTVYPDRVALVAASAGVDAPRLLGRAIAHELGHLLLGRTQHSESGIMRAAWSQQELWRDEVVDWRFSEPDAARIRARVHAR